MAQRSAAVTQHDLPAQSRRVRPIDLVHLAKQCLGDENLEYEVLRLFDTTVQTYMTRLEGAVDPDELAMALHSIKGASGGVGAWTIADLAKGAEEALRADGALSGETIGDLRMAVEEVSGFIRELLSNEAA